MNFEEALNAELRTVAGLENKVFPQIATENTEPPYVCYVSSDGERILTLDGPTDLTELSFEVSIVAKSYEELKAYVQVISNKLRSFFGRNIGTGGPEIKSISLMEPNEEVQKDQNYHRSTFNVRVRF